MKVIVKVITNAKENKVIELDKDNFGTLCYKVKLNVVPVDGKANDLLIEIMAKYFKTAKKNIEITSGLRSKNKLLKINSIFL